MRRLSAFPALAQGGGMLAMLPSRLREGPGVGLSATAAFRAAHPRPLPQAGGESGNAPYAPLPLTGGAGGGHSHTNAAPHHRIGAVS